MMNCNCFLNECCGGSKILCNYMKYLIKKNNGDIVDAIFELNGSDTIELVKKKKKKKVCEAVKVEQQSKLVGEVEAKPMRGEEGAPESDWWDN